MQAGAKRGPASANQCGASGDSGAARNISGGRADDWSGFELFSSTNFIFANDWSDFDLFSSTNFLFFDVRVFLTAIFDFEVPDKRLEVESRFSGFLAAASFIPPFRPLPFKTTRLGRGQRRTLVPLTGEGEVLFFLEASTHLVLKMRIQTCLGTC